jgi:CubicO group peptidase (beta-lactamase class C family)
MPLAKTALIALLASMMVLPAWAQDTSPGVTPSRPIPYSQLAPKPRPKDQSVPRAVPSLAPSAAVVQATPKPPGARLSAAEPLPAPELEAYVDGLVTDAMTREHIAGVSVAIVQNGQVLLKKGYGAASLSPARRVNPDTTLFRLGSVSKTFTWIALMREVEAGRIRIDAPINLYLPEALQVRDQGFRAQVSVLNLMDHSAGFEDRALGHLIEKSVTRERSLAEYLRQERPRRVREAGLLSSYSNYGAALAGEAVSYVTGRSYERLIEDEIFVPLAMSHTTFREPRAVRAGLPAPMPQGLRSDLSEGFRWTQTGYQKRPYEYLGHLAPAGSASSTAADMARYMMALLGNGTMEGTTVFGPKAAAAFRTSIRKTPTGVNGWTHGFIEYGLPGGFKGYGHDGATLSFLSSVVVVPDLQLGIFLSTNTDTGGNLVDRFADRVVGQFYTAESPFPRAGDPRLVGMAPAFRGQYLGTRRAYGGLEATVGRLIEALEVDVTSDGKLITSGQGQSRVWTPEGDPALGRFVAADGQARLAFEMSNGRAQRMQTGLNAQSYERAAIWDWPSLMLTVAILTFLAAGATLIGIFLRNRREFRETSIQGRASLLQNVQAVLWISALTLFLGWLSKTSDVANIMYGWPGPMLLIASACANVAALLNLISLIILPGVWRGGRRVDSWNRWRKGGYAATVAIYLAFSSLLFLWGALTPWST